ncbi:leucine-rich repeat and coiled-coil domain-containing protein 1 [Ipomoea triloba]|uniref:leucine-rich repeat and coiled-coil domain-containing protein 1 n=1 Tax=Ipomoea triloba TaxID=35885 RepID=UPI00125DFC0C|nr:leucine-rich repeat and coiled-coil domain-containing protein 1 [Ipomoea triloba]
MAVLSAKQVLQQSNTGDPNSISNLSLTHKALSDVSCLVEFENIQRLDLSFNNLISIEGLKSCVNLKWLSVAQNKLQSLKGIESFSKLTVLNASKNKLKSMDELSSLVSLGALILNDNEITSICKLDQMKDLNTLVLSRNPIRGIGLFLAKKNSLSKLSLSNCQLECIDSSLKSCTELKELRLSHNEIKTLPSELACNTKLLNLDIGNNEIMRWSDLKVLSSLVNLKNLNLLGNPIAEKEGLAKKIKKLVPTVVTFNAKPIDKILNEGVHPDSIGDWDGKESKPKKQKRSETQEEETLNHKDNIALFNEKSKKKLKLNKNIADKVEVISQDPDVTKESKQKNKKKNENAKEKTSDREMQQLENKKHTNNDIEALSDTRKESKQKKPKKSELVTEKTSNQKVGVAKIEKELGKEQKEAKQSKNAVIDDGETPFMDLFMADMSANSISSGMMETDQGAIHTVDEIAGVVTFNKKKKKNKKQNIDPGALQLSTAADEVGLGGPSTWDA